VTVLVVIDETGKVIAAQAISGHPLLKPASVEAARMSSFKPFLLSGNPVRVKATLIYRFVIGSTI
jgi:hypothetical protein